MTFCVTVVNDVRNVALPIKICGTRNLSVYHLQAYESLGMNASRKRTLDSFLQPSASKRARVSEPNSITGTTEPSAPPSIHPTYPFSIPQLPASIASVLPSLPSSIGREINDQPDLDLLYFEPYIPQRLARELFEFLRIELFFYRVEYKIKRFRVETQIHTPRYTTVFGVDETSKFSPTGFLVDSTTSKPIPKDRYKTCAPRPIPGCLDELRKSAEAATNTTFNFCLVNYYADGADSISYHSDDERFLGSDPAIASFSLGAKRDFLMKHKPPPAPPSGSNKDALPATATSPIKEAPSSNPLKLPLASGDMILMRGRTQSNWLHSIPKRKGRESEGGRINITFRKAMVKGGTENYYCYNVGSGGVFRWDGGRREMVCWKA
ncbi:MAG: hypothetical protein M1836_001347 [Candelina mexicana]|nr:MAG: hypothetical protein M1836_001347 [Candelina mexicana]